MTSRRINIRTEREGAVGYLTGIHRILMVIFTIFHYLYRKMERNDVIVNPRFPTFGEGRWSLFVGRAKHDGIALWINTKADCFDDCFGCSPVDFQIN